MLRTATRSQTVRRVSARRWHSSSSFPPQTEEPANSNNSEVDTADASAVEEKQPAQVKAQESSPVKSTLKTKLVGEPRSSTRASLKKPISVKTHAATIANPASYTVSPPTVNSTHHLDMAVLRNDIFYGGYRPVLTPLRRPVTKTKKTPTIPLSWNMSACKLETFDDFSKVPQFVVDKLVPFASPQNPGNEIRIGAKSRKEQKEMERLSKDVYEFIKHFRK